MSPAPDDPQRTFFDRPMYAVDVRNWPTEKIYPPQAYQEPALAPPGAELTVAPIAPDDARPLPPLDPASSLLRTGDFSLRNSGNRTLNAPKRSWKAELDQGPGPEGEIAGMTCLNMKSMVNDPSQLREALAWRLFASAGVKASQHTFARFGINGRYLGLFSVIEQVDKAMLARHVEGKVRGNLFKVGCGAIGCGTLEYRVGSDGDDSGRQYQTPPETAGAAGSSLESEATYRLRSFSKAPDAESFDDLAALVRTVNGIGLPGGEERFATDAFADRVRAIFDVQPFLRWAAVNVLLGAWDNYFATPGNYYLYNTTRTPGSRDVIGEPFFRFIPWDYDNSFGIDYFGTRWQDTDLLDWPANTEAYRRFNSTSPGPAGRSRIPLVTNLLRHGDFRRYYLEQVEQLLDTTLAPASIDAELARLWPRVATSAYAESDTPYGAPFTGRLFSNDEVYRHVVLQWEVARPDRFINGIRHYVLMRHDRARDQLKTL